MLTSVSMGGLAPYRRRPGTTLGSMSTQHDVLAVAERAREASHGLAQAHVIRLQGPCDPNEVSKLHFHDVEFQMVYVLKGWVKTYMDGQGETLMKEGSCWTQPPRIKHLIMDYSDDVELLEVILPAEFKTVELAT